MLAAVRTEVLAYLSGTYSTQNTHQLSFLYSNVDVFESWGGVLLRPPEVGLLD